MKLTCPLCSKDITEQPKSYKCVCGFTIWKEMSGKTLAHNIIEQLLNEGHTDVMDDFISRNGKKFSAALVLKDNKVGFEFPNRQPQKKQSDIIQKLDDEDENIVRIRIESANSGNVKIVISGAVYKNTEINFGLVGSRMAECLGCITAVKLVKHYSGNHSGIKIRLSINDVNFARYLLSESLPRKAEDKAVLYYLLNELSTFYDWQASHQKKKRSRLQGGPQAKIFPKGVFPWIDVQVVSNGSSLIARVPNTPEVQAQFYASFWKASHGEQGEFILPATAEKAVKAWVYTVKG